MRRRGFPAEPADRECYGLVSFCYNEQGYFSLAMVISPGAKGSTIPHECCHLTDFIFDHVGIPGGPESTEVRAYLTSFLIDETERIVSENQKKHPSFYEMAPERS
ncbi:hypothetical protein [Aphanothece microscopica]|uniref:hypothetical protein n=1 Tax=Aphanothece microscopica TaxID=1049561 RepID=UPI003985679B